MSTDDLYSVLVCVLPYVDDRGDINALREVCRASNIAVRDYLRDGDRYRRFLERGFYDGNIWEMHPCDLADWRIIACDQHDTIERRLLRAEKHLVRVLDCMDDDVFIYLIEVIFKQWHGGFEPVETSTKIIELLRRPRVFPFDVIAWRFPPTTPQNRLMLRFCARIPARFDAFAMRKRDQRRLRQAIARQLGNPDPNFDPIWHNISVASRAQLIIMNHIALDTIVSTQSGVTTMPEWGWRAGREMFARHRNYLETTRGRFYGERAYGPNIESLKPEVKKEHARIVAILKSQMAPSAAQNPQQQCIARFMNYTSDDLVMIADQARIM